MLELRYSNGTLILHGEIPEVIKEHVKWDIRINAYRCLAYKYHELKEKLIENNIEFKEDVLNPPCKSLKVKEIPNLKDYQREALEAWLESGSRGVIVLPTGVGKTYIALASMARLKKPTIIIVPTLELMDQWVDRIQNFFDEDVGRFGGGEKDVKCITVSTYDSAYINAETLGNKFYLMVFDEVHHLPSEGYRQIAILSASPYRLGLTATPEREDGAHELLPEIVGPIVYRRYVSEMAGRYLAEFDIVRIHVSLNDDEQKKYDELRGKFKKFFEERGWTIRGILDFQKLIIKSGRDRRAREALLAWIEARRIALNATNKIEMLKKLLRKHRGDRVIIFTEYNKLVRDISTRFLIPEITHKTPEKERRLTMERFKRGYYNAIVTSKVLEEGIDVPEANVAIILSGSGSRREFIQRLGRILRPKENKRAILYEIVTRGTGEVSISYRRRRALREEIF